MGLARTALFLAIIVSLALITVATFAVLEQVQAEPSGESVVAQQEGVRVVAEIGGSPNLGDSDGDGVPDDSDNCPAWPNTDQSLPPWAIPPGDPDCDGFTTDTENFMGTEPQAACAATNTANDEGPSDAWPFDFNDDQRAALWDVISYIPVFNSFAPGPPYDSRYDLNASGGITLADVMMYIPVFNMTCAP